MVSKAISITVFSGLGVILNFFLQAYLAYRFGARWEMDAFLVSTTLPQLVNMVLIGSMAFTVLPSIIHARETDGISRFWELASVFFTSTIVILLLVALGLYLGATGLTVLMAPGLSDQASALSSELLAVQAAAIVFWGISSVLICAHNGSSSFSWPVLSQSINIVVTGAVTVLLAGHFGILSLGIGILAGAVLQSIALVLTLKERSRLKVKLGLGDHEVRRVALLIIPLVLGSLFVKTDILVDRYLASSLPEGSISYLGYAWRLVATLSGVICSGVVITSFSQICGLVSSNKFDELQGAFERVFRAMLFVLMPIAVFLVLRAQEISSLLFQRGLFTQRDSSDVSIAVIGYLGLLFGHALLLHLSNMFYALRDTVTPTICLAVCFGVGVMAKIWLAGRLSFVGLAIGTSLYYLIDVVSVYLILQRRLNHTLVHNLGSFVFRGCLCSGVMALGILGVDRSIPVNAGLMVHMIVASIVGGVAYISAAYALDLREGKWTVVYAISRLRLSQRS
ncbi:MAG: murein biosynthesis integral membrane protein MurJ [Nitrospirota bacterium]